MSLAEVKGRKNRDSPAVNGDYRFFFVRDNCGCDYYELVLQQKGGGTGWFSPDRMAQSQTGWLSPNWMAQSRLCGHCCPVVISVLSAQWLLLSEKATGQEESASYPHSSSSAHTSFPQDTITGSGLEIINVSVFYTVRGRSQQIDTCHWA